MIFYLVLKKLAPNFFLKSVKSRTRKIGNAYYDTWLMSNIAGVASDIDWNSAAALEFLGVLGLNKEK